MAYSWTRGARRHWTATRPSAQPSRRRSQGRSSRSCQRALSESTNSTRRDSPTRQTGGELSGRKTFTCTGSATVKVDIRVREVRGREGEARVLPRGQLLAYGKGRAHGSVEEWGLTREKWTLSSNWGDWERWHSCEGAGRYTEVLAFLLRGVVQMLHAVVVIEVVTVWQVIEIVCFGPATEAWAKHAVGLDENKTVLISRFESDFWEQAVSASFSESVSRIMQSGSEVCWFEEQFIICLPARSVSNAENDLGINDAEIALSLIEDSASLSLTTSPVNWWKLTLEVKVNGLFK